MLVQETVTVSIMARIMNVSAKLVGLDLVVMTSYAHLTAARSSVKGIVTRLVLCFFLVSICVLLDL